MKKKQTKHYRNNVPVSGIDAGALWIRSGSFLTLMDEDQFVRAPWHPDRFTPVDPDEAGTGPPTKR
nr:hypothetical protein [Bacteroidota bacterium]